MRVADKNKLRSKTTSEYKLFFFFTSCGIYKKKKSNVSFAYTYTPTQQQQ